MRKSRHRAVMSPNLTLYSRSSRVWLSVPRSTFLTLLPTWLFVQVREEAGAPNSNPTPNSNSKITMGLSVAHGPMTSRPNGRIESIYRLAHTLGLSQNIFFSAVATCYVLPHLGATAPLAPGEYGEFQGQNFLPLCLGHTQEGQIVSPHRYCLTRARQ